VGSCSSCLYARSAAAVSARLTHTGATALRYSADAYRSPRTSAPRSSATNCAAAAIRSSDTPCPISARSTDDARVVYVELTEEGEERFAAAFDAMLDERRRLGQVVAELSR